MKKFTRKVKRAFTLIELVVVIAVIAILSAVSVGTYFGVMNSAKVSAANQEAYQIRTALRAETVDGVALTDGTVATLETNGISFKEGTQEWAANLQTFEGYVKEIYFKFSTLDAAKDQALPGNVTITNIYLDKALTVNASASNDSTILVGFELTKDGVPVSLGIVEDKLPTNATPLVTK